MSLKIYKSLIFYIKNKPFKLMGGTSLGGTGTGSGTEDDMDVEDAQHVKKCVLSGALDKEK